MEQLDHSVVINAFSKMYMTRPPFLWGVSLLKMEGMWLPNLQIVVQETIDKGHLSITTPTKYQNFEQRHAWLLNVYLLQNVPYMSVFLGWLLTSA